MSTWYETLREKHRPRRTRVLLVGESPPDPGNGDRRFFYSQQLTIDNLFRGIALAAYGLDKKALARVGKPAVLDRLSADGIWLVDAVDEPINYSTNTERRAAIRAGLPRLIERCRDADPSAGVFICMTPAHDAVVPGLRAAGIHVLNDGPAPFPLGNTRARFVACWRRDVQPHLTGVASW